jgi:hypothetical protein
MARRSLVTPHDDDDGFVTARPHPISDGSVVLYDGQEAGMDTDDGRWIMFCPAHGSMAGETNKARATKLLQQPEDWCDACASTKFGPVTMKVVTFDSDKNPEAAEREMRFWAQRTRGSCEKQELFERMYGVKPDSFWD